MNLVARFEPCALGDLLALREQYLDNLFAGQEALLETMVPRAACHRIVANQTFAGYAITHAGDVLIEFHVTVPFLVHAHQLLADFVRSNGIRTALVKSFDHLFLGAAMDLQVGVRSRGALVRDYVPRPLPVIDRIRYVERVAEAADLPRIRAVEQDVFTNHERLAAVVSRGHVRLFERDEALIGFGVVRPVIPGRPQVDVGLVVDRAYRNRGYAVYMMRDLVEHCRSAGLEPVGGCSMDNEASKQMGLRIGLVARHRLLELRFS